MAGKRTGTLSGISGALQGFLQGYLAARQIKQQEAERVLKQKQFDLDIEKASSGMTAIDPVTGKIYTTTGISPEAKSRLLGTTSQAPATLPGATNLGSGKILPLRSPQVKPEETITNVPEDEFMANPDKYKTGKVNIVKPSKTGLSLDQRANLELMKSAYKIYSETGSVPEHLKAPIQQAFKGLDINLIPEEEQGIIYNLRKFLWGNERYKLVPGKGQKPGKVKMIKVKLRGTEQTGSVPENEFDEAIYERI